MNKIIVYIGLGMLLLCACTGTPDGVLGKEKMARLLVDVHKAEVVAETNSRLYTDSLKRVLRQSVYARHGVTQAQVDSSLKWYGYNMEKYMEVYDRSIEILENDLQKARETAGASTEKSNVYVSFEGDSVDVWTGERMHRFNANMPSNLISFNITRDQNWELGDAYTLRPKLVGFSGPLEVLLAVQYRDGSIEYVSRQLNGDGWHSLTLALDSVKDSRAVYGTIMYNPRGNENAFLDSISLYRSRKAPYLNEARIRQRKFSNKQWRVAY